MSDHIVLSDYIFRINKVIDFVEDNIGENIKLKDLADVACFSQYHFHRIFDMLMGETPKDFLRRIRIERSAMMLKSTNDSMADIAFKCGFSSQATFSRAFREYFNCSPSAWKQNIRNSQLDLISSKLSAKYNHTNSSHPGSKLQIEEVKEFLSAYKIGNTDMNVEIKTLESKRVAYVANHGGYIRKYIRSAWNRLYSWAKMQNIIKSETDFISIGFDDPKVTPRNKCRYYACISIPDETEVSGEVGLLNTHPGRYAVWRVNVYGYELEKCYDELVGAWLPANGYEPAHIPSLQIFHNPLSNHHTQKFDLSICIPIK